jgi:hypothetical protein
MTVSTNSNGAAGTEFTSDEFDEGYPHGYELHYWNRARSAIVKDYVGRCCGKGDTVLEIGSSRGHYVRVMRAAGFDAYGCDLGGPLVYEDVRDFVFPNTDFADLDLSLRERVTAVLLLDVIEHVQRPADFLRSVVEAMPALRSLIIAVPARQELWSNYDEHWRHFLRYDIQKLREVARDSRLSIDAWSYFFHALYVPAWILERLGLKRATAFPAPKGNFWLHRWLGHMFWLESRWLPKQAFGTSLICVCTPEGRGEASVRGRRQHASSP